MNEESGYLIERKCANCGKIFCPAPEHVYKDDDKAFCKWSCLCEYRKHKEIEALLEILDFVKEKVGMEQ